MQLKDAYRKEYEAFLRETGFDNPDPHALLMDLASLSMDVYLKEVVWLSDFIGRLNRAGQRAA